MSDAPSPDVETVLAQHRHPGEFLTVFGEAWLVCSCGTRIDLPVRDNKVSSDEAATLFEAHQAAALRGAGLPEPSVSVPVRVLRGLLDETDYDKSNALHGEVQAILTDWQEATP
jgi:hypothetical protein